MRYYNIARIQPWVGCIDNAPARVLVPGEQVRAQSENVQVGSFAIFPVIVFAFGLSFRGEFWVFYFFALWPAACDFEGVTIKSVV